MLSRLDCIANRVINHSTDSSPSVITLAHQVGSAIVAAVGVELPATVAFDYPSVAAIGQFVEDTLFPDADSAKATGFLTGVPTGAGNAAGSLAAAAALLGSGMESGFAAEIAVRTAITGMGLRLPRTTSDAQTYWELLASGGDCVTKVRRIFNSHQCRPLPRHTI